jgi:tRNA U38,U39,U40 pseudouridine synthase TruA
VLSNARHPRGRDLLVFHVEGSHFLWKMVRRLVGVLVEVGAAGSRTMTRRSCWSRRRFAGAMTAPASGLFLERCLRGDARDVELPSPRERDADVRDANGVPRRRDMAGQPPTGGGPCAADLSSRRG